MLFTLSVVSSAHLDFKIQPTLGDISWFLLHVLPAKCHQLKMAKGHTQEVDGDVGL